MAKEKTQWVCIECGHSQPKWSGSCLSCKRWNTMQELHIPKESKKVYLSKKKEDSKPVLIKDIKHNQFNRVKSGFVELDRLMGGGVVKGSLNLLGGKPGIGKSTLMLQLSLAFAKQGLVVLYVCGEESIEQTSLRAQRLGATTENLYLFSETVFSQIKASVDQIKPDILIIDSAQIVYRDDLPSSPGSVLQVKEIAMECMHIAKQYGIITFLVGHVTKSGDLAGPRVLEHLVDTVLDFEGDQKQGYRILRSSKNRFGPTDDIVIFQMKQTGLDEVKNPSLVFIEERKSNIPGSVITPALEGSRALLIEVQALVSKTAYATPVRKATGVDPNRLTLLLAVLEKRLKIPLYSSDVFVSVAGGIKVYEPGIDLAIMLSVASSFLSSAIPSDLAVIGEVGLNGELRSVSRFENRIKECFHMGFSSLLVPKKCVSEISKELLSKIKLNAIETIQDALTFCFGSVCK